MEGMKQTQTRSVSLLLLAILSVLQDQQPGSVCRLETKYDALADTTTVMCYDLVKFGEAPSGLSVRADAFFHGKEQDRGKGSDEIGRFWFVLSSDRSGSTRHTPPLFEVATTLYLSVDSTRLEIPLEDYRHDFFDLTRFCSESARAEIGRDDLQKLLEAKSLKGEWGGVEFQFSKAALASLKDFISSRVFAVRTH
jgi:hypothetical protein